MLKGKTVVLGVTGSIAAYKIANLASMLVKQHAEVHVLMTENAAKFITPITFETLTNQKCIVDTFDREFEFDVKHISLAQKADIFMVAPASANVIGKIANGIADDMLTTTIMACEAPKLIAPAMNTHMFLNPIVQDNMEKLRKYGYEIIEPASGRLACGDTGAGKMPEPEVLLNYILRTIGRPHDMNGKKVLITAGPTQEAIDPVRFITNHSTGKMGYAIARAAMLRSAKVTLVTGPVSITPPPFVDVVKVTTAAQMAEAVKVIAPAQDIIIKSAAVADYKPKHVAPEKIKKTEGDSVIELDRTEDILAYLGAHKYPGQFICGFAMETENVLENSRAKLEKKNADMIVSNSLRTNGAGFGGDTNVVTLITKESAKEYPLMSKDEVGDVILDTIMEKIELPEITMDLDEM